jgi:dethiobiotin synthetase
MAHPVILIGTGTSVGKTYVGERLLRAFAHRGVAAVGYKPVESGYKDGVDSDIARLERASSFHVKPSLRSWTYAAPLSPHLAARREGKSVPVDAIREEVQRGCASLASILVIELPGGAFSPFTDAICCADFARSLIGARTLLVASDRLGVLHDVTSTVRACAALGLPLAGIVLSAPQAPDESTGHNAEELRALTLVPILASLPRDEASGSVGDADPILRVADLLPSSS